MRWIALARDLRWLNVSDTTEPHYGNGKACVYCKLVCLAHINSLKQSCPIIGVYSHHYSSSGLFEVCSPLRKPFSSILINLSILSTFEN